jgi:hypothetical protein
VAPNNPHVTSYQWVAAQTPSGNLFDGAEHGTSNFIVTISPGYSVITNGPVASGSWSYLLAMPDGSDQILQLNRVLFPATNSLLSFASRLGYATINQVAKVQVSTTGGLNWQDIFSQAGNGGANDSAYTNRSLSLSNYAGQSLLLRFNYHLSPNADGSYNFYVPPQGWLIDNILVTNTLQLTNLSTNSTASTNYVFTPAQAGSYILEAQPVIFNQFPIGFGPISQLTAVVGSPPLVTLAPPVLTGGQVQLSFSVSGGTATTFKLLQASQLAAGWTTNSSAVLTTNVAGSAYRFTTPVAAGARFYRIQTP